LFVNIETTIRENVRLASYKPVTERFAILIAPTGPSDGKWPDHVCPYGGDNLERAANGEHPEETQQAHRGQTQKWERKGEQEKQVHRGVSA
jgi:hypothetical protein